MIFNKDVFCPELVESDSVRIVLEKLLECNSRPIRVGDLLDAVRESGGATINLFDLCFNAANTGQPIAAIAKAVPNIRLNRTDFSSNALSALDEFAAILDGSGKEVLPFALPLLVGCAQRQPEAKDWPGCPAAEAENVFLRVLDRIKNVETEPPVPPVTAELDAQFTLPPQLARCEDLTYRARTADPGGPYPFDNEPTYEAVFEAVARVLHRRQGRHVFLTGERGVGKTSVVAEFARRAAAGSYPFLAVKRFVQIDARFTPADETRSRLEAILSHLSGRPDLVACIDGFSSLLRAERGGSNKPALMSCLVSARCQLVALMTPQEYDELAADDPDLGEFFTRVEVPEAEPQVAHRLMRHFAQGLARRFQVLIDPGAVQTSVTLTANYVLNDQLPAKSLKALSRACEEADYDRRQLGRPKEQVSAEDVVRIVSEWTAIPESTLCGVAERVDYEQALKEVIFGQDHVVREVATELGLIKAGMVETTKPASVLLFLGQTGTGKTEMAKALARFYSTSKRLKTYTLGNCVEPHSVATIIGVPPGYVGSDRGGRLVNELNADPYCVVLLDEADKAHPDVLQPFLNLFDEGWVTDQRGGKAYGTKAIFILTTNVGQRMIADMAREGKPPDEIAGRMKEALSQIRHNKSDRPVFTPEFLARIKRVIVFKPLDKEAMTAIARKQIAQIKLNWSEMRGKQLQISDEIAAYIGAAAYRLDEKSGGKEGGRIVRKLVADWLESQIQRAIAEYPLEYRRAANVVVGATFPPELTVDQPYSAPSVSVQLN